VLIDSTHKRWAIWSVLLAAVSLSGFIWIDSRTPGGLTGGTTAGLWYGIAGSALMIFAGLLSSLRHVPAWWWLGPRKQWLRGHIWLGLLSVVVILCHAGFRWGGALTGSLWVVLGLVVLTGILGVILQQFLPHMIYTRIPCEASYDQIPHLCKGLVHRADQAMATIWDADIPATEVSFFSSQTGVGAKVQLQEFYETHVLPFLSRHYRGAFLLAQPLRAQSAFDYLRDLPGLAGVREQIEELRELCTERRLLGEQERLHRYLHGWLPVHIALSIALLVLGIAHVVGSLYY
jgi:hypothetical protein